MFTFSASYNYPLLARSPVRTPLLLCGLVSSVPPPPIASWCTSRRTSNRRNSDGVLFSPMYTNWPDLVTRNACGRTKPCDMNITRPVINAKWHKRWNMVVKPTQQYNIGFVRIYKVEARLNKKKSQKTKFHIRVDTPRELQTRTIFYFPTLHFCLFYSAEACIQTTKLNLGFSFRITHARQK